MSFSKEWEDRFSENSHISKWPWTDLVSYVMRYTKISNETNVLELGCGSGANIPFFLSFKKLNYYGIDGSETIIKLLQKKFSNIKNNLVIGDFTTKLPFDEKFDIIIDRAALTSNTTNGIKKGLELVYEKLQPGGKYIGIDLYSTSSSEFSRGQNDEDKFTKVNFMDGPFFEIGKIHFFDKPHIFELFHKFNIIRLEHKLRKLEIPESNYVFASWNMIAEKPIV